MSKNGKKNIFQRYIKKGSFVWGVTFGLIISSAVTWAAFVIPHIFTSGSVISASEMNNNFAAIQAELNALKGGVVLKLAADELNMPTDCGTPVVPPAGTFIAHVNDGNWDDVTGRYTAPVNGVYEWTITGTSETNLQYYQFKNGVQTSNAAGSGGGQNRITLVAGDYLEIDYMNTSCVATANALAAEMFFKIQLVMETP